MRFEVSRIIRCFRTGSHGPIRREPAMANFVQTQPCFNANVANSMFARPRSECRELQVREAQVHAEIWPDRIFRTIFDWGLYVWRLCQERRILRYKWWELAVF